MQPHKGSQETYDFIADWIAPDFFYSKKDVWHRFGFLGVFGDFVLSCTQGDVLEIGVGESSIYLSHVTRKYHRKIYHCDVAASKIDNPLTVKGYLDTEIGVFFRCPSDEMFAKGNITPIALGFIDGDHIYEQVKKDFYNLLLLVVDNGYIILHDTYPPSEDYVDENRCGTVYRLRQEIEKDDSLDCITLVSGCAMGVGLTICRKKPKNRNYYNE